jgi:wyosine [tRNA(Phe)-imidazoG37] synthetase (radical SAM superfamily)
MKVFCDLPWKKAYVEADGSWHFCCHDNENNLGNVNVKSIKETWYSPLATEVRRQIAAGILPQGCKCRCCPFRFQQLVPKFEVSEQSGPSWVEIALPNTCCNVGGTKPTPETACMFCPRASRDFVPQKEITFWPMLDKLRPLIPDLGLLSICGVGEPFWRNQLWRVLNILDFYRYRHIRLAITSNALVFDKDQADRMLSQVPHSGIHFSLDAVSEGIYSKIRRGNFREAMTNIKYYVLHPRRNREQQEAHINYHINMLNIGNCEKMIRMWTGMPIQGIHVSPTYFNVPGTEHLLVNPENAALFKAAEQKMMKAAEEIGVPLIFFGPLDNGLADPPQKIFL